MHIVAITIIREKFRWTSDFCAYIKKVHWKKLTEYKAVAGTLACNFLKQLLLFFFRYAELTLSKILEIHFPSAGEIV